MPTRSSPLGATSNAWSAPAAASRRRSRAPSAGPTPTPAPRPGWPTRRAWRCWPTLPLPSRSTRRRSTPSISPADFPDDAGLQHLTREIYQRGGIVSSVCHGYCGLLNTRLDDGRLLVAGRRLTGYSWIEEVLAGVARKVPYNVEEEMKRRGALYERSLLPFTSKVVVDGRLVTGQNPQSAKATAEQVAALLG